MSGSLPRAPRLLLTFLALALGALTPLGVRAQEDEVRIDLVTVDGTQVGIASFMPAGSDVFMWVEVWDQPPGFHGLHLHAAGACDGASGFLSAGGHVNPDGNIHGDHAGDLPSLYVTAEGTGFLSFWTDRFTLEMLRDADGSALIVHAGPDNFAHIPTRYGVTPDETTLGTGDSGARIACGVIPAG